MKKMNLNFVVAILSVIMVAFVASCDPDDPKPETKSYVPVLGTDFAFTVDANTVNFTSTLAGTVWFRNISEAKDISVSGGVASTNIALKGEYPFTCNVIAEDGLTYTSDTFKVTIAQDDLSFCESGLFKALTGGANKTKTWALDTAKVFFHNPLDFYGDSEIGGAADNIWGPWGGTSLYDWGGYPETGNIVFDCATGKATVNLNGEVKTAVFSMSVYERPADFLTLTDGKTLWENMITGKYSYLGALSAQMADITFSDGLRFPMDGGRIADNQFLESDLANVKIMHLSDSAMVVRVKRTYEGVDENGAQKESKCWLLYNYVVSEYTYAKEEFTYSEAVKTSFTAADLIGTWKYAAMPQGWVAFTATGNKGTVIPAHLFGKWDTREQAVTDLVSWGNANADSIFTANDALEFVFNADGTCTLNGIANTYTVANGVVTFNTALTTEFSCVNITLTGNELKVLDFAHYGDAVEAYTPLGMWIGNKNGDKDEYQAVQLVKK